MFAPGLQLPAGFSSPAAPVCALAVDRPAAALPAAAFAAGAFVAGADTRR